MNQKGFLLVLPIIFGISSSISAQDYFDLYSRGALAIELGNCTEGESLIDQALKLKDKGDFRKNYFPHYFLAICAMKREDFEQAQKFAKQAEGSGIGFSSRARDYANFKKQLQAKMKEPKRSALSLLVLVNTENNLTDVSFDDLCRIYRGEKRQWENGSDIVPVIGPTGSPENNLLLKKCGIEEKSLSSLWKDIETKGKKLPLVVENQEWILRYIFSNPGAIAFYRNMPGLQQVKIISVDGKNAATANYMLSE